MTAALALLAALALYAGWIEPRRLLVRRHTASLPGLAAPLRVLVIADLQPFRHHWPGRRLSRAFARAQAENPDLVLWLGDYYNAPTKGGASLLRRLGLERAYAALNTPMADIAAAMARLRAPMGAFAILGNHDWAWDGAACAQALRAAGITVLVDERAEARHPQRGVAVTLVGLDDASAGREPRLPLGPLDGPAIVLTHAPDVWDRIDPPPALTLAGHTHGGQVIVPGYGPPRLTELGRRYVKGWFARGDARLFVSTGMGCSGLPVRFGVPPEIVVLDLSPERPTG